MEDLIESLFTEGIEMDALEQQLAEQQQQLAGRLKLSSHDRRAFGGGGSTASSMSGRAELSTMIPEGRHSNKRGRSPRRADFVASASCASFATSAKKTTPRDKPGASREISSTDARALSWSSC